MKRKAFPTNKCRVQIQLYIISLYNLILRILPFHQARVFFLRMCGASVGKGVAVHGRVYFTRPGNLQLGAYSTINKDCYVDTRGGVAVGDSVMIGHNSFIYTAGHDIDCKDFSGYNAGVEIGDYAVVFPHSLIMPGVKVGKGAVILTGSVVTKDVDEFAVVGGNPCKFIKHRSHGLNYRHEYRFWVANA